MSAEVAHAWLAMLLVAGCSSTPTRTDARTGAVQARDVCRDRRLLATLSGEVDCYPYRCVDGRCLRACDSRADCAGAVGPDELAEHGWPLDCVSGRCAPLPPENVTGDAP